MKLPPAVVFVGVCAAVLGAWLLYFLFIRGVFGPLEHAGVFGDMFGGFTAMVSAFGFAGIVTTLYLQMRELEESREERKKADAINEEQRKLTRKQIELFSAQLNELSEQRDRERQQRLHEIEPFFHFSLTYTPNTWFVRRRGGEICDAEAAGSGIGNQWRVRFAEQPDEQGTIGNVSILAGEEFRVTYTRIADRQTRYQTFRANGEGIERIPDEHWRARSKASERSPTA